MHIDLQAISIFKRALIIKSAKITAPALNFSRIDETTYSFSDLIPDPDKSKAESPESSSPFLFSINNIEVIDGDIFFSDQPKDKTHRISKLNFALASISNLPYRVETFIQPTFSANVNGTPLSLNGDTKPFAASHESDININIENLNIAEYATYLPNPTKALLSSCLLDIKGNVDFASAKSNTPNTLSYTGQIIFKEIAITDREGEKFVEFPKITITTSASNLLDLKIHISDLEIETPKFIVKRTKDLQILPLSFLLPAANEASLKTTDANEEKVDSSEQNQPSRYNLAIDNISVTNGNLAFTDESVDNFGTIIQPFSFTMKDFNTAQAKTASYDLSVMTESSETISSKGAVQINPLAAHGNISVNNIVLPKYMPYAKTLLSPEITNGVLDLSTDFTLSISNDNSQAIRLDNSSVLLKQFKLVDKGKPVVNLPEISVTGSQIDLANKTINIANFSSRQASFTIVRGPNNLLNIASFVKEPPSNKIEKNKKPVEQNSPSEQETPWGFSLESAVLSDHELIFIDQSLAKPTSLRSHNAAIKLSDFSTTGPPASIDFSTQLNDSGSISARGKIGVAPLFLELDTQIDQLGFKPFQPYVDQRLNVLITDGSLSSSGVLSLHHESKAPVLRFKGTGAIDNFASIDTHLREDLVRWKKINLALSFSSAPFKLEIADVQWDEPYAKVVISDQGVINLSDLSKKTKTNPAPEEQTPQEQSDTPANKDIEIKKFEVRNGHFDFIDNKIQPTYSASLTSFGGTVTGLSSTIDTRADVSFEGKLNQFSPLDISGSINPLAKDLFADLKINFHDIELSPTSPYTGKHIGYKTDKGKLTLNLHYIVQGKEIEAKNHIFLDQFNLGDSVDSPDAVSLPIHLALALLKNRAGEISLDIPVQGNLADPKFSIGGVVAKVLVNLITKAVTSPFALLGALIPDGEDLQLVPFEPGLATISTDHFNNLSQIASVLYDRPGLRMDIVGKVDPKKDGDAIAEFRFQKMLKTQKAKDQQGLFSNDKQPNAEDVIVTEEEYPRYLVLAYKDMIDKKDTRSKGAKTWSKFTDFVKGESPEKNLSNEEIKGQILKEIAATDDDLRLLAHERAANVKNHLMASGKVEAERLFVLEPKVLPLKESADSATDLNNIAMQVDLVIK